MGALASFPVQRDPVQHGVGDNQQAGRLQLGTKAVNIKDRIRLTVCIKSRQAKKTKNMDRTFLIDLARSKHERQSQSRNKPKLTRC